MPYPRLLLGSRPIYVRQGKNRHQSFTNTQRLGSISGEDDWGKEPSNGAGIQMSLCGKRHSGGLIIVGLRPSPGYLSKLRPFLGGGHTSHPYHLTLPIRTPPLSPLAPTNTAEKLVPLRLPATDVERNPFDHAA